ncbi:MAG: CPBP family intramembrane glutamic endopeptidase [Armatimonadota bacterium]|nr:CPBP family intramembrane glutamic endopeptidase [Armatimonadota bacterium]MDR7548369.1 CPBP family intramembrane glutamic endopeptidase [Armatimonadota bacterium]
MGFSAVYPVPESTVATAVMLVIVGTAGLSVYLLAYRPTGGRATWGISEIAAVTILFLVTLPLVALLAGVGIPLNLADLTVVMLAQNVLLVGMPAYVVTVRYRRPLEALGLRADGWPQHALLGLAAGAVTTLVFNSGEQVVVYLFGLVEGAEQAAARAAAEHLADPLRPLLSNLTSTPSLVWLLVLLAVVVPIGEEVFFRGFVYGGLRARWGITVAVLASAGFFAVVHRQLVHGVLIFLLGVVLALLYERTRSLVPAVVTHALTNILAVVSIWRGWGI